jgi:hypothetical protein
MGTKNNTVHNEHFKSTLVLDITRKDIRNFLCFKFVLVFLSETVRLSAVVFIFRNKIAQRFDQNASVPVPVPVIRNINLIRNVYAKAERKNRMQKRDMISHIKADPVPAEAIKQRN